MLTIKEERRKYLDRLKNQPRVVITSKEAVAQRYQKYFTGVACKNGHVDFRYVKSGGCVKCKSLSNYSQSTILDSYERRLTK